MLEILEIVAGKDLVEMVKWIPDSVVPVPWHHRLPLEFYQKSEPGHLQRHSWEGKTSLSILVSSISHPEIR